MSTPAMNPDSALIVRLIAPSGTPAGLALEYLGRVAISRALPCVEFVDADVDCDGEIVAGPDVVGAARWVDPLLRARQRAALLSQLGRPGGRIERLVELDDAWLAVSGGREMHLDASHGSAAVACALTDGADVEAVTEGGSCFEAFAVADDVEAAEEAATRWAGRELDRVISDSVERDPMRLRHLLAAVSHEAKRLREAHTALRGRYDADIEAVRQACR